MDTTQRKPKHKILNPFPLEGDDDINDPLAIQKRSKISCNSALSCCHDPLLSDSERDFCTHNLMIADWERWPFTSLKKKNVCPSSFFLQFPLLHHHLLWAFDQSNPNPASCCSATANQSSWCSRVCVSGGVGNGGQREEEKGGGLILKGDEAQYTEAAMIRTNKRISISRQTLKSIFSVIFKVCIWGHIWWICNTQQ